LSITNSSQGGGGILVHGWAHNLQIANNRVYNNQGTLAGGISIGQGEHPDAPQVGAAIITLPGSCISGAGLPVNTQLPHCFDTNVNVHHNSVTLNASEGDELFSATPSGAGGVAFCTGADYYKFNYNWVCGNLTTGDGAGVTQVGFVWDGDIEHNAILFNQATNPTTPSNGGGLMIMSGLDTDPTCPGPPDADCNHAYGTVGEGTGPGLTVNANLIIGNAAEAGSGGGIRFQGVNGLEVGNFPNSCVTLFTCQWFMVNVTNNIIANNVAGWDGGGVSLQDSIGVNLINNTIVSNDSTASSGTLFGAFFADRASAPTPCPRDAIGANLRCVPLSTPEPAGISAGEHTAEFLASLPASLICPPGHPLSTTTPLLGVVNGACRHVSFPVLFNDVLWQNRAFHIDVVQPGTGSGQQQATVSLVPQLNQTTTGACVAPQANTPLYWDIGLRGDTGPTDHSSGYTWQPKASVLTSTTGYPGGPTGFAANTSSFSPGVVKQYCNGSKIPPEAGKDTWYQVPPGTNEGNVPTPVFSLTAGATVDEGNNWVNIMWGPLSLINPTTETNPSTETMLGDYSLATGSTAINYITLLGSSATYMLAPQYDFFGTQRKTAADPQVDAGAVEFRGAAGAGPTLATISPNSGVRGQGVPVTITGTNLTGATINPIAGVAISGVTVTATQINATFTIARNAALGARNVTVTTPGGTSNALTFTVQGATVTISAPSPAMTTIPANTTTKLATVTVTNAAAATGPLNISAVAVTKTAGPASGAFSIVAGPLTTCVAPMSLAPGANCTIRVQYAPGGSTGTSTAHIALTNTGATTNPLNGPNFNAN
jgi:hypothetical protein